MPVQKFIPLGPSWTSRPGIASYYVEGVEESNVMTPGVITASNVGIVAGGKRNSVVFQFPRLESSSSAHTIGSDACGQETPSLPVFRATNLFY